MSPRALELLAPARNLEIGIAAIDCGADAVYIAAEEFGARSAAGNPVSDIRELCTYAHRYGARIFVTVNTIIYDQELSKVQSLIRELEDAGADAFIVQDLSVASMAGIPVHASTQCSIRTPDRARFYESQGFSRLVLERQLSLSEISAISSSVGAEIECFVHGALCVCYSGQCYLSEAIAGRSANRGECIQACRSLYDLVDDKGRVILRNKPLLSLKDFNLISRLEDLAEAGSTSFKIEGRLKNISYVRNVVRAYSKALDEMVREHPDKYRRASFGRVEGGFIPDLGKTFNRGYTTLYLDGRRGDWVTPDAAKGMGEPVGTVESVLAGGSVIRIRPDSRSIILRNGDGFAFVTRDGSVVGFRGDVCSGKEIRCKAVESLLPGTRLYRNISASFEKELDNASSTRLLDVMLDVQVLSDGVIIKASREDGTVMERTFAAKGEKANNADRMLALIDSQLSKRSGFHSFKVRTLIASEDIPLLPSSEINAMRRSVSDELGGIPAAKIPLAKGSRGTVPAAKEITYKDNVANSLARKALKEAGAESIEDAYEITHREDAELMRSRYCIRHQMGMCLRDTKDTRRLALVNNGRRFPLKFDCSRCEMVVTSD